MIPSVGFLIAQGRTCGLVIEVGLVMILLADVGLRER